jgi:hypothetical protein
MISRARLDATQHGASYASALSDDASSDAIEAVPRDVVRKKEKPRHRSDGAFKIVLVPEIGIEPTTYALRMRRSTN